MIYTRQALGPTNYHYEEKVDDKPTSHSLHTSQTLHTSPDTGGNVSDRADPCVGLTHADPSVPLTRANGAESNNGRFCCGFDPCRTAPDNRHQHRQHPTPNNLHNNLNRHQYPENPTPINNQTTPSPETTTSTSPSPKVPPNIRPQIYFIPAPNISCMGQAGALPILPTRNRAPPKKQEAKMRDAKVAKHMDLLERICEVMSFAQIMSTSE